MSPITEAAHMALKRAYHKLHRAEAYAARLRCELAHTPAGSEHTHTIAVELKAAGAQVARYRTRYDQAEQAAIAATPRMRSPLL